MERIVLIINDLLAKVTSLLYDLWYKAIILYVTSLQNRLHLFENSNGEMVYKLVDSTEAEK